MHLPVPQKAGFELLARPHYTPLPLEASTFPPRGQPDGMLTEVDEAPVVAPEVKRHEEAAHEGGMLEEEAQDPAPDKVAQQVERQPGKAVKQMLGWECLPVFQMSCW
jgi:hypothetical protein